ncbi:MULTISPECIES: hypothetical protein [Myroides]|uniref:Uncharacterized protein n=1 Tax=Myroides albus TaxID=2562892 RepID=A0A6I3LG94_9FLAO|nr:MULTISPECIES: hypothetical protein [Myroides]MTG96566.1 hypothetical protein [Myroides albus]MVX34562.1 hypothetical protein [Myroides sp. LoEW2-1]UVD81020.1 hypothetical protein NWE55_07170 [Myroides albus]
MGDSNNHKSQDLDEIDLKYLKESAVSLFDTVGFGIFRLIRLVLSYWYLFTLAIIIGVGLGYYKESNIPEKALEEQVSNVQKDIQKYSILISPKVESVDYLKYLVSSNFKNTFSSQELLSSRLIGVDDIYNWLSKDSSYVKTLALIGTNLNSHEDLIQNYATSKNYHYQDLRIEVNSDFEINRFVEELQNYFDSLPLFKKKLELAKQGLLLKQIEYCKDLERINHALDIVKNGNKLSLDSESRILSLVKFKHELLELIQDNEFELLESDHVVYLLGVVKDERELDKHYVGNVVKEASKNKMIMYSLFLILLVFIGLGVYKLYTHYSNRK